MTLRNPKEVGVLQMCEALHMALTGAGDPLNPEDARIYVWALSARLQNWRPSMLPWTTEYDQAIQNLIRATLHECRRSPEWFVNP